MAFFSLDDLCYPSIHIPVPIFFFKEGTPAAHLNSNFHYALKNESQKPNDQQTQQQQNGIRSPKESSRDKQKLGNDDYICWRTASILFGKLAPRTLGRVHDARSAHGAAEPAQD
jgi:hypothetical protein